MACSTLLGVLSYVHGVFGCRTRALTSMNASAPPTVVADMRNLNSANVEVTSMNNDFGSAVDTVNLGSLRTYPQVYAQL